MEMTTVKTVAVMAIIFGCFAILFPKIFHPMILNIFGMGSKSDTNDEFGRMPPHMRPHHPPGGNRRPMQDDITNHIRQPGPHPGLRAAAEMKRQAASQQGAGRGGGMMGTVLPMYAIGIVVYLIYTLSKVMGKKNESKEELREQYQDVRFDPDKKEFVYGRQREDDDMYDDDYREYLRQKRKDNEIKHMMEAGKGKLGEKDLQKLKKGLFKIEDQLEKLVDNEEPGLKEKDPLEGSSEMMELKRRLMETEAQMERILKAMETVQQTVGEVADEEIIPDVKQTRVGASVDSSPDLDSYDVISSQKNTNEDQTSESEQEIEEIGAAGTELNDEEEDNEPMNVQSQREQSHDQGEPCDLSGDESCDEEVMQEETGSDKEEETRPGLRKRVHQDEKS